MRTRTILRLFAPCCVMIGIGAAQTPPPESRLAVGIPADHGLPPTYETVGNGLTTLWLFDQNLHRLPDSDPDARQPSAVTLAMKRAGDTVTIIATAYFGNFDHQRIPTDTSTLQHETVGTYTGKLNDAVTLSDMDRFGLEPLTINIVTAQFDHPDVPLIRSEAPSLQVDLASLDRNTDTMTVHNLSGKAVTALRVGAASNGSGWGHEIQRGGLSELVAAGGTNQFTVSPGSSGRIVNGNYEEDPPPATIVLQAVLFADGSFEGDRQFALGMMARQIGHAVQRQRIESAAQPILAETESDDQAKIKRILALADQLSTQPDAQMTESLRSQVPDLTGKELADAQSQFSAGMENEKEMLQMNLKQFLPGSGLGLSHISLARWWAVAYKSS